MTPPVGAHTPRRASGMTPRAGSLTPRRTGLSGGARRVSVSDIERAAGKCQSSPWQPRGCSFLGTSVEICTCCQARRRATQEDSDVSEHQHWPCLTLFGTSYR